MDRLTLNHTQRKALKLAMQKDGAQETINGMTPDRGYAFEMENTVRIVESILNSPRTKQHHRAKR